MGADHSHAGVLCNIMFCGMPRDVDLLSEPADQRMRMAAGFRGAAAAMANVGEAMRLMGKQLTDLAKMLEENGD